MSPELIIEILNRSTSAAISINSAATLNPYTWLFGFVDAAGLIGFNTGAQVVIDDAAGLNIDDLKPICGNYIYWGGYPLPTGVFPIVINANVSFILLVRSISGMSIQTIYTGSVGMGSLTRKYERVFTDRWGTWLDLGAVNSPH